MKVIRSATSSMVNPSAALSGINDQVWPTLPAIPLSWASGSVQVSGLAESGAAVRIFNENRLSGEATALAEDFEESFDIPTYVETAVMSSNGQHLAYTSNNAIWLYDLATGEQTRVAQDAVAPVWSFDGKTLAYTASDQNWNEKIYLFDMEAQHTALLIDEPDASVSSPSWTRDGTLIAFQRSGSSDPGSPISALTGKCRRTRPFRPRFRNAHSRSANWAVVRMS
jgi:dipeptidyl aminopeptidase/acylaminoacyl peptidase